MFTHRKKKTLSRRQCSIVFILVKFLQSFYIPTEKQQKKVHYSTTVLHSATVHLENYSNQTLNNALMQGIIHESTTLKVHLAEVY